MNLDADFQLDFADFEKKLTGDVRVVSLTTASNVTGTVFDLARVRDLIRSKRLPSTSGRGAGGEGSILFIVDGSQGIPHFRVDVQSLDIDYLVFTGHKLMSDTGIGIMYGKKSLLKKLTPSIGGGGAINWVREDSLSLRRDFHLDLNQGLRILSGQEACSEQLNLWNRLVDTGNRDASKKIWFLIHLQNGTIFKKLFPEVRLIGSEKEEGRIGVFSFVTEKIHISDLADAFADREICVRAGHHCAEPLMQSQGISGSVRMSLFLYNTHEDIDRFFEAFTEILMNVK